MSKAKNGLVAAAGLLIGIVTLRAIRNRSGDSAEELAESEQAEESDETVEAEQAEEADETVEAGVAETDELSDPEAIVRTEAEAAAEHLTAAAEHARVAGESALEYARAELEGTEVAAAREE